MMTIEEKIEMYKGKKAFIDNISRAFEARPSGSTVDSVEYEVYRKDMEDDRAFFEEFLIVNFFGGSKSVRVANGNSNTANFRALGTLIDGGYYDEICNYESLADRGFTKVNLDEFKLNQLLAKPMTHISDVRDCFNYCRNLEDVEKVIEMIPSAFGYFEADFKDSEEDGTFVVFNEWWTEDGSDSEYEYTEYEFYTEK